MNTNTVIARRDDLSDLIGTACAYAAAGHKAGASCVYWPCARGSLSVVLYINSTPAVDTGARVPASDKLGRPRRRRRAPPGFCTIPRVAELCAVAVSTAYRWVEIGALRASLWRGSMVIAETEVRRFLDVQPLPIAGTAGHQRDDAPIASASTG